MTPRDKAVLASCHYAETRAQVDLLETGGGGTSDLSAHTGAAGGVMLCVLGRQVVSLDIEQMDQLVAWWTGACDG